MGTKSAQPSCRRYNRMNGRLGSCIRFSFSQTAAWIEITLRFGVVGQGHILCGRGASKLGILYPHPLRFLMLCSAETTSFFPSFLSFLLTYFLTYLPTYLLTYLHTHSQRDVMAVRGCSGQWRTMVISRVLFSGPKARY